MESLAARCSLFCLSLSLIISLSHTHTHAHTLTPGQSHEQAHTHPHSRKEFSIFFVLFFIFFFFFFLKKDLSKYLDNKSCAFPKKLGFSFPLWFWCCSFSSWSLTSGLKFLSSFPFPFCFGQEKAVRVNCT